MVSREQMYHFIDGTAGLGKTTLLKSLQNMGLDVVFGDYHEDCLNHPQFRDKVVVPRLDLEYQIHVLSRQKRGAIHDRPLWANVVYTYILQYLAASPEKRAFLVQEFSDACRRTFINLPTSYYNVLNIICNDSQAPLLVDRMLKRSNGIDLMSIDYVIAQNLFFRLLAENSNFKLLVLEDINDFDYLHSQVKNLLGIDCNPLLYVPVSETSCLVSKNPPLRGTSGSAGLDLYNYSSDIVVAPNSLVRVRLGLKFNIPTGHFGQIFARSSLTRFGLFCLSNVIDSDFRGEVSVILTNFGPTSVTIPHLSRFCQIVVSPYNTSNAVMVASLTETARGSGGFGSTDEN